MRRAVIIEGAGSMDAQACMVRRNLGRERRQHTSGQPGDPHCPELTSSVLLRAAGTSIEPDWTRSEVDDRVRLGRTIDGKLAITEFVANFCCANRTLPFKTLEKLPTHAVPARSLEKNIRIGYICSMPDQAPLLASLTAMNELFATGRPHRFMIPAILSDLDDRVEREDC